MIRKLAYAAAGIGPFHETVRCDCTFERFRERGCCRSAIPADLPITSLGMRYRRPATFRHDLFGGILGS